MKRTSILNNWLTIAQNICLPPSCVLCGSRGEDGLDLCRACLAELPLNGSACRRCALPIPESGVGLCGRCQRRPPPFEHAIAPFRYQPPMDHLLLTLKFRQGLHMARLLGSLLAAQLAVSHHPLPQLIVPMPLHPSRLRERGYNQALELARPVARELGVPLAPRLCRRVRATAGQSGLNARERRRNVRGVFTVEGEIPPGTVAILDDVVTTGSTAEELARCLIRAGAERVEVWALARAALG